MKQFVLILSLLALISTSSCGGKKEHFKLPSRPDMTACKGKVTENLFCRADSNSSYALFLPSAYDSARSWPLIIAFDSHADGLLPVTLLKEEAEKWGYILIGSNNSRNGLAMEVTSAMFDALYDDAIWRFHIDTGRIYTMGFSGGARVAAYQALYKSNIRGLIGCSAGFPSIQGLPPVIFDYLGIGGTDDFNLLEMNRLFQSLGQTGIPHFLITFDGIHAWPPKELVSDIFSWLQLGALRQGLIKSDSSLTDNFVKHINDRISQKKNGNDWIKVLELNDMACHFLRGFPQVKAFEKQKLLLEENPQVIAAVQNRELWMNREHGLQENYLMALQDKNVEWWKNEVPRMNAIIKSTAGSEEAHVYKRVLGYLSLACYINASGMLKSGQEEAFRHYVALYTLIDPENSETAYLQAVVDMKGQKGDNAIASLKKALELGFADVKRLETDTSFISLHNHPDFQEMVRKLKK